MKMDDVIIKGGCRTITSEADAAHDVTFTSSRGLLMAVTTDGRLVLGKGLSLDAATDEVADKLVEYFGHGYGGQLREALDRARKAETEARRLNAALKAQTDRAYKAEVKAEAVKDELMETRAELKAAQKAKEDRP